MNKKTEDAISIIKECEEEALLMNDDGFWAAFSGGKDSVVLLDLVAKANVKYVAAFNQTTVDPPELLSFIREHYPEVKWVRPIESMFSLIIRKRFPPTRRVRYCCEYLKEHSGVGWFKITGIRKDESIGRRKRQIIEAGHGGHGTKFLNPILEWSDNDVWSYIHSNDLSYCSLYDEGFSRIGCIGCPMVCTKTRMLEFERWPRFEAAYRKAIELMIEKNRVDIASGKYKPSKRGWNWNLVTVDEVWEWWMTGNTPNSTIPLFPPN